MDLNKGIFVAGHRGLVGSAVVRKLKAIGASDIITRSRQELDLLDQAAVNRFFREAKPSYVVMAAARVGGIYANSTQQADFLYENLVLSTNVMHAAAENGTEKLLYLGSSCIYPRLAPQPLSESSLLTGPLEPTNEGYALAKIAGLKLCEMYQRQYKKRFISAMPTNLYGPGDNYHPLHSHVIPGMMRRFHEAKVARAEAVTIWGTGKPKREFMYVDDLAEALVVLLDRYENPQTINVGTGSEVTIGELAIMMKEVIDFRGEIRFDSSKPDGTPRKILDHSRIEALGWTPKYTLISGLEKAYATALREKVFDENQSKQGSE